MTWKKAGQSNFIRFEAGKSIEGIYQGYEERPNPFKESNPNAPDMITDYRIEVDGVQKTISSTARTLEDQLKSLTAPCAVKVDFVQKGVRKWFVVWTQE